MIVRTMILAGALGLAAAGSAWAQAAGPQAGEPSAAVKEACATDVRSLCPSAQPGTGQLRECMRQNAAKLSLPCKRALHAAHASRQQAAPPTSP